MPPASACASFDRNRQYACDVPAGPSTSIDSEDGVMSNALSPRYRISVPAP
jgi:hypothetical protein